MANCALEIIESELGRCTQDLLAFYSSEPEERFEVIASPASDVLREFVDCSSIGLTGEYFKLSVVILAPRSTIAQFCPIPNASTADWIGELANQLVGRLKNALIDYGHEGRLSLPVTLSGSCIQLWNETASPKSYVVRTARGQIIVRLEAEVQPDSVWEPCENSGTAAEGSMCLF